MAGFRTHITTSTTLGIAYGGAAFSLYNAPLPACVLAGGMCGVAGMLPDLDSGPGVPLRESVAFAAAVIPMMLVQRFRQEMSLESTVLIVGALYLLIRFGIGHMLTRLTVHRGMFHSLPALLIAGEATFLVYSSEDLALRYFLASAVMIGFFSHLLLDEIWSIDVRHVRLKSSFGTAIKFWGECGWANVATYLNLALLTFIVFQDPVWSKPETAESANLKQMAAQAIERLWK